jgi:preprotein translocase subunit SecD
MNRYPLWKYLVLGVALLIGLIYTLPNLYGEAPAVQVSSARTTVKVTDEVLGRVQQALDAAQVKADFVQLDGSSVRARFVDTDVQLKAKDAIQAALNKDPANPDFIVALNLVSRSPQWLARLHAFPMYLGLDLRGGVHFLMEVDMRAAITKRVESLVGDARAQLRENKLYGSVSRDGDRLVISLREAAFMQPARNLLTDKLPEMAWEPGANANELVGALKPTSLVAIQESALKQNITTLHNRVNELGTAEPVIQQQGLNRVVVQLPGVQDTARAKDIIGRTATLQFRLVDEAGGPGTEQVPVRLQPGETTPRMVYLKREVIATGEQLDRADATIDQNQRPAVSVRLDAAGGRAMKQATSENLKKPMAIVLYEKGKGEAISVATIQGEFGTDFQITGNFTSTETADMALLTRAGSLAAPMEIIEERTIGPSLGAENIDRGFDSVKWGFLAVAAFMCVYYMLFGLISSLALGFNLLLLIAVLSMLQATLSLPGMAAIALVLGMAIDSNVLINERIREELREGKNPQQAIHIGYEKAWETIFDSNVTTLIAGLALLAWGSGPIKGFAVVHCLGILTSMFSAVLFSRGLVNLWYGRQRKLKSVSIGQIWKPGEARPEVAEEPAQG